MGKYKYHYFYRIENIINGKYYYGIHSTNNLDDGYMGSGRNLKRDYKIYGKENFVKTIIKYFQSRELASEYESEMVSETCVLDENCYNMKIGGDFGTTVGTILVKDYSSKFLRVLPNDKRLESGELIPVSKGMVPVYDKQSCSFKLVEREDYSSNNDKYIHVCNGTIIVKDKNGMATRVSFDDERYINGDLIPFWRGRKHTQETKDKMSKTHKANNDQSGEKNSQFGTCWITNGVENKKIKKEDINIFLNKGWSKGRKMNTEKWQSGLLHMS